MKEYSCPTCGVSYALTPPVLFNCVACWKSFHVDEQGITTTGAKTAEITELTATNFDEVWSSIERRIATSAWPFEIIPPKFFSHITPDGAAFLIEKLDSNNIAIVVNAGIALSQCPQHAEIVAPKFVEMLSDDNGIVRIHAKWVLRTLPDVVPILIDQFKAHPEHRESIAEFFGFLGPRGAPALDILTEHNNNCMACREALSYLQPPWKTDPKSPVPYIGEQVLMEKVEDSEDPDPLGMSLWLRFLQDRKHLNEDEWEVLERSAWNDQGDESFDFVWAPDQVAYGEPTLTLLIWTEDDEIKAPLKADNGKWFSSEELLRKLLDQHYQIANSPERIFEGLRHREGNLFSIETGY